MKRLGIITYHAAINEGAMLQAYTLCHALRERFPQYAVEVVNERSARCERKELTDTLRTWPRYAFSGVNRWRRLRSFWKKNIPLSRESIVTDDYDKAVAFLDGKYDVLVTGSDSIWSIRGLTRPFPSVFWLHPSLTCKKIAYAASADRCNVHELQQWERDLAKELLEAYDLISVRDRNTLEMVSSLGVSGAGAVPIVPDPTFLFDIKPTRAKEILLRAGLDLERPILAVSIKDGPRSPSAIAKALYTKYKATGWQVVSISKVNRFVDASLIDKLTPFEWADAFRHFSLVISDLFHGTVFALKTSTPFVTLEMDSTYSATTSKMRSLLMDFDLTDNLVRRSECESDFNVLFEAADRAQAEWNPDSVAAKLSVMKHTSLAFFEQMACVLEQCGDGVGCTCERAR